MNRALALWRLGRYSEAQLAVTSAARLLEGRSSELYAAALAIDAAARMARGQLEGIDLIIARARDDARGGTFWEYSAVAFGLLGIAELERGRTDEASALRDEAEALIRSHGWEPPGSLDVVMSVLRRRLGR